MPVPFDAKTIEYYITDEGRKVRGRTNPETWKLVKDRYVVLRDFLPKEIIRFAMDIWKADEENGGLYTNQEVKDITYKNQSSIGKSKGGYCTPWGVALHGFIHNKLKDYIDLDLRETYSYTRRYERGAYLGSHTDRPSCEISATLCLDYQTDDNKPPWKIWVRNDKNYANVSAETVKNESQDLTHRERVKNNCKSISLEPGDILLYQGPNIPHWRDYLLGEYSYHLFVHFFNATSKMNQIDDFIIGRNHDVETPQEKFALELDGRAQTDGFKRTNK